MEKTFQLEILASDRPFYVGPAEHLVFPTVDGLVGILPGHESMVTIVSPGELKYQVDGVWRYAAISEDLQKSAGTMFWYWAMPLSCRKKLTQSVPQRPQSVQRSACSTNRALCSIITARLH